MVLLLGVMKLVLDLIGVLNGVFDFLIGVLNPEVGTIVLDGVVKTLFLQLSTSIKKYISDNYSIAQHCDRNGGNGNGKYCSKHQAAKLSLGTSFNDLLSP